MSSGIRPTAVKKGITGVDDPLAKYRVQNNPNDTASVDWDKEIRSASRADTTTPTTYVPQEKPIEQRYVPPSANTTILPARTDVRNPTSQFSSSNPYVRPEQGIKPSALKDGSDVLQKYRIKTPEEEEMTWEISLRQIPASLGKSVLFQVDGSVLYSGEGTNGIVTANVTTMCSSENSGTSQVLFKINAINFNLNRNLEISKGRFVRFSVESGQMKFRQQKTPFDD